MVICKPTKNNKVMCGEWNNEMPQLWNQDELRGAQHAYGQIGLAMENLIPLKFYGEIGFKS